MENSAFKFGLISSALLLASSSAFGANVTLGSANDGNCYPFNCNDSGSASGQSIHYQQIFNGAQFGSSPISITSITFSDQYLPGFGFDNVPLLSGTYTISFAVSNASIGGLSSTLANNITSGFASFLTNTTAGIAAGFSTLSFNGSPYLYNPSSGNLLIDIVVSNQANVNSLTYVPANGLDADSSGIDTSRAYQIGRNTFVDSLGLVTEFTYDVAAVNTPEPTTFALIGGGLLLFGWKRRQALARKGALAATAMIVATVALSSTASAQISKSTPRTIAVPKHTAGGATARTPLVGTLQQPLTVPHFSRSYTINSTVYPQNFVGTDPASTNVTTNVTVPVIPVIISLNDGAGPNFDPARKLSTSPGGSALSATLATLTSPLFQNASYTTGGTNVGSSIQFGDAIQRATFWSNVSTTSPNWHTVLKFQLKPTITLNVPAASGKDTGAGIATVDLDWLGSQLDTLAASYDPTTFPLFLLYNVVETQNGGDTCCVLGYHTALLVGSNIQTYGMGAYLDAGLFGGGISDVSVLSHEVAEWLNDPFVDNIVPDWPAPFTFDVPGPPYTPGACQNNLETGDPLEDRSNSNFHITTSGRQYTLQNEALAPWFLRVTPSFSVNGYYTFLGPVDSEFAGPAPACVTLQ